MRRIIKYNSKLTPERARLLVFLLKILKYKYNGNGIEFGYSNGIYEYWCHDDGSYSRREV